MATDNHAKFDAGREVPLLLASDIERAEQHFGIGRGLRHGRAGNTCDQDQRDADHHNAMHRGSPFWEYGIDGPQSWPLRKTEACSVEFRCHWPRLAFVALARHYPHPDRASPAPELIRFYITRLNDCGKGFPEFLIGQRRSFLDKGMGWITWCRLGLLSHLQAGRAVSLYRRMKGGRRRR